MSLVDKFRFYPASLKLRSRIAAARALLDGPFRWKALDELGVPGHGADLLRVDFPPAADAKPRWGRDGMPPHPELTALVDKRAPAQMELLRECLGYADVLRTWPRTEDTSRPEVPWTENEFLTRFDQLSLYGMLRHLRPERYVEIGSGMSTRVAWQARNDGGFPMRIISIDPEPRFAIAGLCDEVHRRRLEDAAHKLPSMVSGRTVVFFDGSHRCLPASDVTVFFLEILPRLPSGTSIHIHDIYLPADYPAGTFVRFWSEQYLLAAYLLGGARGVEVLLPCAHFAARPEARGLIESALGPGASGGSSFWLSRT